MYKNIAISISTTVLIGAVLTAVPVVISADDTNNPKERTSEKKLRELRSLNQTIQKDPTNVPSSPRAAALNAATSDQEQLRAAKVRRVLMEEIAVKDPQTFLMNVMPAAVRAKLPPIIQAEVEQQTTLTGTLDVLHVDDFTKPDNSHFAYHLTAGKERLTLHTVGPAQALTSGTAVEVKGHRLGKKVVAQGDDNGIKVKKKPKLETTGNQRTLVILITQPDAPSTPTGDQMRKTIFNGNFQKYYAEQSYNNIRFTGNVTSWISVPSSTNPGCTSPWLDQPEVKNYILKNKINLANFDRVMFVINGWQGGCAFVGKMDVQFNGQTYRLSLGWTGWPDDAWRDPRSPMLGFEYVFAHEMGHQLGVMHANAWSCTGPSLDTDCYHSEYGNRFDVMGVGFYGGHFNAFYKDLLGWLATSSKVFITKSGSYTLNPIELKQGARAAIITNPSAPTIPPLYLEFRQPFGFDALIPPESAGILLNQVVRGHFPFPRLINANYAKDPWSQQALMQDGSFIWESHGISIASTSIQAAKGSRPASASFRVDVLPVICRLVGLETANIYGITEFASGTYGYLSFSLRNNDNANCAPSDVRISASISDGNGWNVYAYPESTTIAPGEEQWASVSFGAPVEALGPNKLTVTITDITNGRTYLIERALNVVAPPIIESIVPYSTTAGSYIVINGSGFAQAPDHTNSIYLYTVATSSSFSAYMPGIYAASSTSITFMVPSTMEEYIFPQWEERGVHAAQVPTPAGVYHLMVGRSSDGAWSNQASFEVVSSGAPPISRRESQARSSQLAGVLAAIGRAFQSFFGAAAR